MPVWRFLPRMASPGLKHINQRRPWKVFLVISGVCKFTSCFTCLCHVCRFLSFKVPGEHLQMEQVGQGSLPFPAGAGERANQTPRRAPP